MSLVCKVVNIVGKVISKDNARFFNKSGFNYLPKSYTDYEKGVAVQMKLQVDKPYLCDLVVFTDFFMKSKVHSDLTNLPKSLYDAGNGILWKDDRQIKECHLRVVYAKDKPEGARITIIEREKEC